jgi:hypothetical protein
MMLQAAGVTLRRFEPAIEEITLDFNVDHI